MLYGVICGFLELRQNLKLLSAAMFGGASRVSYWYNE